MIKLFKKKKYKEYKIIRYGCFNEVKNDSIVSLYTEKSFKKEKDVKPEMYDKLEIPVKLLKKGI